MSVVELEIGRLDQRYAGLCARQKGKEAAVLSSMSEAGQRSPVVVVAEGTQFVVIDGFKRVKAAQKLAQVKSRFVCRSERGTE